MDHFFSVTSQHHDADVVIEDCLKQLENRPEDANFGFIYATDAMSLEFPELLRLCKRQTGIDRWVGSLGIGIISSHQEHYDSPAVSILLANFPEEDVAMLPLLSTDQNLADKIETPKPFLTHFGVVHGDPFHQITQEIVTALHEELEHGFLVGGLTSSQQDQFQVAGDIHTGGVSGALFSENIAVQTNLSQGCSPVSDKFKVTRQQDNVAFTLGTEPALDVLMEAFDITDKEQLEERAPELFVGLCVPGSDRSDYMIRNLVGADIKHKIFAINDFLVEDQELLFCERNAQTAVDDMKQMLLSLKQRVKSPILGGLYVSCLGRGREQFGKDSQEIGMIHDVFGDFPLTGFFANGEIHHDKLYGYTGVLTLFTAS